MSKHLALFVALLLCPASASARFVQQGKAEQYDRTTVWQAINGAAEVYMAYGFRSLRIQHFKRGKLQVTAQVYQLGSPLDAFGVVQLERPEKGVEGICVDRKGSFYLRLIATSGKLAPRDCKLLFKRLTKRLQGSGEKPKELALLPAEGRVPGSERFTRKSYLGSRHLRSCLHARYSRGGKAFQLFAILPGQRETVGQMWKRLAKRWKQSELQGAKIVTATIPYQGTLALVRGERAIFGAVGLPDLAASVAILKGMLR